MRTSSVIHSISHILAYSNIIDSQPASSPVLMIMGCFSICRFARLALSFARAHASTAMIGQAQMARVAAQLSATSAGPR